MISHFFIDRPIFAAVLSILVTIAGSVAVIGLPVAQYPDITPPTVLVTASYPGANAQTVPDTVAAPIEQQVNGVEGMLYMSSQCANDGSYTLTITFEHGVDLDIAQVLVQNRVALAQPTLPPLVQRNGVSIKKKAPGTLMIVNLHSPDGSKDDLFLSNYATIQIRDELARLPGVGDIAYIGQRDYSMRLWLDPDRMAARKVTPAEITRAVETQNTQVAAGQIGQPPLGTGPAFQLTMSTLGRLMEADQFANLVVKTDPQGRLVRLRDVAEIEMGAQGYEQSCTLDGKPSVALTVHQLPGSNALETARLVRARMEQLAARFPEGIAHEIVYDTSPFIQESIREVFRTLLEAVALVALVILLFLGDWRAAVIPLLAVPVAVVGTFAAMLACGYSLNTLTLFGLVLAIGIVVDDAIVVVEAVEHELGKGLAPREATISAMQQVAGPVLAVGLVLSAVFVPCLFIGGISGQFFRQFALTIAVSTLLSAFNSLTLSPALAALLLKSGAGGHGHRAPLPRLAFPVMGALAALWFVPGWLAGRFTLPAGVPDWAVPVGCGLAGVLLGWLVAGPLNVALGLGFGWFNRGFAWVTRGYTLSVRGLLKIPVLVLAGYGALVWVTAQGFEKAPKGFIPEQDKGYLLVNLQLPDASSLGRTRAAVLRMEQAAREVQGVRHTVAVSGRSALLEANAPHFGAMYVLLDPFEERKGQALGAEAIARELTRALEAAAPEGQVTVLGAPPVDGLGNAGGFRLVLEDRGEVGLEGLQEIADRVVARAAEDPLVEGTYSSLRADTPWVHLDIDRVQAQSMGVPIGEILDALQMYLGSFYINDFNRFGRTWQVIAQAGGKARQSLEDLRSIRVQSTRGGDGAPGHAGDQPAGGRAGLSVAAQPVPGGPLDLQRRARSEFGPGDRPDGRAGEGGAGVVDAVGMDRAGLPAAGDGRHGHGGLRAGCGAGVFGVGGAIRELGAADGGDPGGAAVSVVRAGGGVADPDRHQHLHAGWLCGADRPGLQERDFDCGVCPGPARRGGRAGGGDAGGVRAAPEAHCDDFAGVHHRRGAAAGGAGGGCRDAADSGHRGVQRHAGGDAVRRVFDAGVLFCDRLGGGKGAGEQNHWIVDMLCPQACARLKLPA